MDFARTALKNLTDPQPSYEWTRAALVNTINDYVRASLLRNVNSPCLGVKGTILFPNSATLPYYYLPNTGPSCGGVISFTPGMATEADYDSVATKTRNGNRSFWENYFELIGRTLFRSVVSIAPITTSGGNSTPFPYTADTLSSTNSYYLTIGNAFTLNKPLDDWRAAGLAVVRQMKSRYYQDSEEVWNLVGANVKRVANRMYLWRYYTGAIKRFTDPAPGAFTGHIFGNLIFD
jgi:hypothetical protein